MAGEGYVSAGERAHRRRLEALRKPQTRKVGPFAKGDDDEGSDVEDAYWDGYWDGWDQAVATIADMAGEEE